MCFILISIWLGLVWHLYQDQTNDNWFTQSNCYKSPYLEKWAELVEQADRWNVTTNKGSRILSFQKKLETDSIRRIRQKDNEQWVIESRIKFRFTI